MSLFLRSEKNDFTQVRLRAGINKCGTISINMWDPSW